MKNKKVIITMVVTISVLLILGIVISVINISKADIVKVAKNDEILENTNTENQTQENNTEETLEEVSEDDSERIDTNNMQEARSAAINNNSIIGTLSSRSEVNRSGSMYINTNADSY